MITHTHSIRPVTVPFESPFPAAQTHPWPLCLCSVCSGSSAVRSEPGSADHCCCPAGPGGWAACAPAPEPLHSGLRATERRNRGQPVWVRPQGAGSSAGSYPALPCRDVLQGSHGGFETRGAAVAVLQNPPVQPHHPGVPEPLSPFGVGQRGDDRMSLLWRERESSSVFIHSKSQPKTDRGLFHLMGLFAVKREAADGVRLPGRRRSGRPLQVELHGGGQLRVQLIGQVSHHAQGILQTLRETQQDSRSDPACPCSPVGSF